MVAAIAIIAVALTSALVAGLLYRRRQHHLLQKISFMQELDMLESEKVCAYLAYCLDFNRHFDAQINIRVVIYSHALARCSTSLISNIAAMHQLQMRLCNCVYILFACR